MVFLSCHNKLTDIQNMGFKINWTFLKIGLKGSEDLQAQISYCEMLEYLESILASEEERFDDIIMLLCEKEDTDEMDKQLDALVVKEAKDVYFELRKWRAYILHDMLKHVNEDCLQGLLSLMEFWLPYKDEKYCPLIFPERGGQGVQVQEYFTQDMYNSLLEKNRNWLQQEIVYILDKDI